MWLGGEGRKESKRNVEEIGWISVAVVAGEETKGTRPDLGDR